MFLNKRIRSGFFAMGLTAAMFVQACGGEESGGGVPDPPATPTPTTPTPSPTPSATASPPTGGVVTDYRPFVVRPADVLFLDERNPSRSAHDPQFPDLVAWGQVVTLRMGQSGMTNAKVHIRSLRLIRRTTVETLIGQLPLDKPDGSRLPCAIEAGIEKGECTGANYSRSPWFTDNSQKEPMLNSSIRANVLEIDASQEPNRVSHFWTIGESAAYRSTSSSEGEYFVEAEFRVEGAAAVQFGLDRWRTTSLNPCPSNWQEEFDQPDCNHKQSMFSVWIGDTGGRWVRGRFPLRFLQA
jgi:hypothetical protein